MGRLQDFLLRHELNPRVMHRLPGRVRLHLPALKRLASFQGDITKAVADFLALPDGIEAVSADTRSGSVLICYQSQAINESEVLERVRSLSRRVRQQWPRLQNLDPSTNRDEILVCLQESDCER